MPRGHLTAGGAVDEGIRTEGPPLSPVAGGDGHDDLGRGPGLGGAAHQQPQEHPQRHRGLPLAAGQDQSRPGTLELCLVEASNGVLRVL